MSYRSLIGKELQNGKYKIVSFIGSGGMAEVYEGFDTKLKRKVAIKVLSHWYINNQYILRRFYEEAEIAASCDHPNIVKIYDIQSEGDIHFTAMQFLPTSLSSLLKEKKILPSLKAVTILKPIAEALAYIHNKGIVHRDIKPSNIMFDEHNNPILTDFGIAQRDDTTRFQGSVATGTPEYMSPEQVKGEQIDFRSDIYSLGIVLYELVTGNVPFQAEDPQSVLYKHVYEPLPEKPLEENGVLKPVREILFKCLAKFPDNRFRSTQALVDALNNIIGSSPTPLPISTARRRLKTKFVIIPLLVAISIIIGVGFIYQPHTSNRLSSFIFHLFRPKPSPFATISLSLLDSTHNDSPIPFPGDIYFNGIGEKAIPLRIEKGNMVVKFYPADSLRLEFHKPNADSSKNNFAIHCPLKDTLLVTIIANVPYYDLGYTKEETLVKGTNSEIEIKLTPKDRFCARCRKKFGLADTVCSSCGWKRAR